MRCCRQPKPAGDPVLYKDLNRTRAIMRGQRKVDVLEKSRRALEVQQQSLTLDYSNSLLEVESELRDVRTRRLDEATSLATRIDQLEGDLDARKAAEAAAAEEKARRTLEAGRMAKDLERAQEDARSVERLHQARERELEFENEGLAAEKERLGAELARVTQGESEALHRAERSEAEAGALREEMKGKTWELRKLKNMCQNLQSKTTTQDELRMQMHLVEVELAKEKEAAAAYASGAVARERELLERLHVARDEVKRDKEVAEVRENFFWHGLGDGEFGGKKFGPLCGGLS